MAPSINDVSTDLESPPKFRLADIGDLPAEYKPVIREHYADLAPLVYEEKSPATVWAAALAVAQRTPRWQVTSADEPRYIEGVATTLVLRFRDDFIIRLTPKGDSGTIVDMRSRSRIGKGDLGVNATRIRQFLQNLDDELADDS